MSRKYYSGDFNVLHLIFYVYTVLYTLLYTYWKGVL